MNLGLVQSRLSGFGVPDNDRVANRRQSPGARQQTATQQQAESAPTRDVSAASNGQRDASGMRVNAGGIYNIDLRYLNPQAIKDARTARDQTAISTTPQNPIPVESEYTTQRRPGEVSIYPEQASSNTPNAEGSEVGDPEAAEEETQTKPGESRKPNGEPLTDDETKEVEKLKDRDKEVREHEQAHKSAAGELAQGGPSYQYELGPDGKRYAVGGEVKIDSSPEEDPEDTITKMQRVRRAALAPKEPSAQDREVAAEASQEEAKARQELRAERMASVTGQESNGNVGFESDELGYDSPVEAFGRLNNDASANTEVDFAGLNEDERAVFNDFNDNDPFLDRFGREYEASVRLESRVGDIYSRSTAPTYTFSGNALNALG